MKTKKIKVSDDGNDIKRLRAHTDPAAVGRV